HLDLPIGLRHRPRDGNVVSFLHCMNDPQPEGHMASYIQRRKFLATLGGSLAAAWPLAARAQQGERGRRIGRVWAIADDGLEAQSRSAAFGKGLRDLGWVEGCNVHIDYRFAAGDANRIKAYVAELVTLAPDVFLANSTPVVAALRQATTSIPIVFAVVNDPVGQGFISSLAHPGGNITGFTFIEFTMVGKWLEMLKAVSPGMARAALMFNPNTSPYYDVYLRSFEAIPRSIAVEVTATLFATRPKSKRLSRNLDASPAVG